MLGGCNNSVTQSPFFLFRFPPKLENGCKFHCPFPVKSETDGRYTDLIRILSSNEFSPVQSSSTSAMRTRLYRRRRRRKLTAERARAVWCIRHRRRPLQRRSIQTSSLYVLRSTDACLPACLPGVHTRADVCRRTDDVEGFFYSRGVDEVACHCRLRQLPSYTVKKVSVYARIVCVEFSAF